VSGSPIRFVTLGDSYTIGTATAKPAERWPDQLVERLGGTAGGIALVANLGVNGYTSRDVLDDELPGLADLRPQLVSLLVGVNDVVQGVPADIYAGNVAAILDELLGVVPASRIVTISTPDYTVTPRGAEYGDPATQSAAIRRFNRVLEEAATSRDIAFVDIHDLSLRAEADPRLIAADGLHPSAEQYRLWVDRIAPAVSRVLA
jgi:lysophospholipase L1-like esterase